MSSLYEWEINVSAGHSAGLLAGFAYASRGVIAARMNVDGADLRKFLLA